MRNWRKLLSYLILILSLTILYFFQEEPSDNNSIKNAKNKYVNMVTKDKGPYKLNTHGTQFQSLDSKSYIPETDFQVDSLVLFDEEEALNQLTESGLNEEEAEAQFEAIDSANRDYEDIRFVNNKESVEEYLTASESVSEPELIPPMLQPNDIESQLTAAGISEEQARRITDMVIESADITEENLQENGSELRPIDDVKI